MNTEKKHMIATIVKEKRVKLKYTQQELADISNISLRSIQRIEKGEVVPRMHTLKTLSECLHFPLDFLDKNDHYVIAHSKILLVRKRIISVVSVLLILLLSAAFIAQSSTFPETNFELLMFAILSIGIIGFVLIKLWKKDNRTQSPNTPSKNA
jgi:transcriptional regulator with XRE-family HTH domain